MSDNRPEYTGRAYKIFSKKWDFKHITSSPHFPISNGQVERTIQTIKKTLKKAFRTNEDPYLALLAIRTSSGPENNTQPSTLFYNRPIRTFLPTLNRNRKIINNKHHQNNYTDQSNKKSLPPLKENDIVRLYDGTNWTIKGKIIKQLKDQPRSYLVKTQNGKIIKRNRKDVLLSKKENESNNLEKTENNEYPLFTFSQTNTRKNDNNNTDNINNQINETSTRQTRSGRIIRRPRRFEDYV